MKKMEEKKGTLIFVDDDDKKRSITITNFKVNNTVFSFTDLSGKESIVNISRLIKYKHLPHIKGDSQ